MDYLKVIIAGGRDYEFTPDDYAFLDSIKEKISVVVSGGARGADKSGESWAGSRQIDVVTFLADWQKHGKAAGPIRNRLMAEYADAVVLFPGGKGTESMYQEATKRGLFIFDRRKPIDF